MTDVSRLIEKHRANGLLIDTNLVILLLVGRISKRKIHEFKRTQTYTVENYERLEQFVGEFSNLITTPHVLTEVSNLTTRGRDVMRFAEELIHHVAQAQEFYDESTQVVEDSCFPRFGLADAAIATLGRRSLLVLTDDFPLCGVLQKRGVDVINFNHIRGWT